MTYDDIAAWPAVAENDKSLERINTLAFADDPLNWQASAGGAIPGIPALLGCNPLAADASGAIVITLEADAAAISPPRRTSIGPSPPGAWMNR